MFWNTLCEFHINQDLGEIYTTNSSYITLNIYSSTYTVKLFEDLEVLEEGPRHPNVAFQSRARAEGLLLIQSNVLEFDFYSRWKLDTGIFSASRGRGGGTGWSRPWVQTSTSRGTHSYALTWPHCILKIIFPVYKEAHKPIWVERRWGEMGTESPTDEIELMISRSQDESSKLSL